MFRKKVLDANIWNQEYMKNVELVSVEYKQTDRGSELIAFNFVNSEDEQFAHTEWKTMPHKNIDTMSEKESDLYIRLVTSQLRKNQ